MNLTENDLPALAELYKQFWGEDSCLDSMTSGREFPPLSEENRVGLLRLVLDNITEPDTPRSFTPALAAEILDFVAGVWGQSEVLLIHCDVGVSRSPAVAAALSRIYYGSWCWRSLGALDPEQSRQRPPATCQNARRDQVHGVVSLPYPARFA